MPLSPVFATGVDASAVIISAAAGASVVAWVLADVNGRAEADARVDAGAIVDGEADANALVDALGDGHALADGDADVDTLAITLGDADADALVCAAARAVWFARTHRAADTTLATAARLGRTAWQLGLATTRWPRRRSSW